MRRADRALKSLSPGYFALVMATGIVSIGLRESGFDVVAHSLLAFAVLSWSVGALLYAGIAGTGIIDMTATPMVQAAGAFIGGTVISFWCFAAWLIPMLLAAGVWRHIVNRVPLRYTPGLWSMVFPLGMFAVASSAER